MEAFDLLSGTARSWHRRCCRVSSPLRGMWMPILGDGWPSEWRSSRSPYPHREAVHDAESDALLEVSMNGTELTELLRHRLLLAASVMFIQIFSADSPHRRSFTHFLSAEVVRGERRFDSLPRQIGDLVKPLRSFCRQYRLSETHRDVLPQGFAHGANHGGGLWGGSKCRLL